jgi:hypothetical protein
MLHLRQKAASVMIGTSGQLCPDVDLNNPPINPHIGSLLTDAPINPGTADPDAPDVVSDVTRAQEEFYIVLGCLHNTATSPEVDLYILQRANFKSSQKSGFRIKPNLSLN